MLVSAHIVLLLCVNTHCAEILEASRCKKLRIGIQVDQLATTRHNTAVEDVLHKHHPRHGDRTT